MAFFKQLSKQKLHEEFDEIGWFMFCPIYAKEFPDGDMVVEERNWIPHWVFKLALFCHDFGNQILMSFGKEPVMFAFKVKPMETKNAADSE